MSKLDIAKTVNIKNKKASFVQMPKDKRHAITVALISLASKSPSGTLNQQTLTSDEIAVRGAALFRRHTELLVQTAG